MIYISDLLYPNEMKSLFGQIDAGVESIEFSIADSLDQLENSIIKYRRRMECYGTANLTIHGPFLDLNPMSFDSRIRHATMDRFAQAYEAGLSLGADKIIFHSGFIPSVNFIEGWAERMADFWNAFLERRGELQVLMENVLDPFPEPLLQVKNMVSADNFKLCLDIGHANCYSKRSVRQWIDRLGSSIGHVHLHNNDGSRDAHQALTSGTIPAEETLKQLKNVAPEASYTIECNSVQDILDTYYLLTNTPDTRNITDKEN